MSSEIIFFQHFVEKIQQKHFLYISNELLLFNSFQPQIIWDFFKTCLKENCFDTNISNCLLMNFLEFFP